MSVPVALAELADRIESYGATAYLVTTGENGQPHVVAVRVAWAGQVLTVGAGRTTSANASRQPEVTLLWSAPPGDAYCLIVDGTAVPGPGDTLEITPGRAVLHRTPDGDPAAPSCITVLPRT